MWHLVCMACRMWAVWVASAVSAKEEAHATEVRALNEKLLHAASVVPLMSKGKEWARTAHIGVNAVTFGLFAYYQIPTGLEIAAKVIEKTKFP